MPGNSVNESVDVLVYLNRGGLREDAGPGAEERKRWALEFSYTALQSRHIGNVIFRFDPGNPRSMIRANRDLRKAVICVQSSGFELSPQWFQAELQSALRAKPGRLFEPDEAEGKALFEATKAFLHFAGDQLANMNLSSMEQKSRFGPRVHNGRTEGPLRLDLSRNGNLSPTDHLALLRLWWLTLDCFRRGIEGALHRQVLTDDQESRVIRATVLKLRAHLGASLLDFQVFDDPSLLATLHESMLEWIDFNLGNRTRDDDIDFLDSRHEELGDLLFEVKPASPHLLSPFRGLQSNGAPPAIGDWRESRHIAVREAVLSAQRLPDERRSRDIIDRYADCLHRTGELFSKRYDIRELVAISNAWPEIRKSPARRLPLRERATAFLKGTWRHLPWPYPTFLLLGFVGWLLFAWNTSGQTLLRPFTDTAFSIVFSAQYSIVYAVLVYFILFARLARKLRLFAQAMPRILGSLIVGYVPLWLPQETWSFPFYMSWEAVLVFTFVLLIISYLYFAVEVSGKVKMRGEALQKATAVFLIAAAQAYCIGLLITDFSARYFTEALPASLIGNKGVGGKDFADLHVMLESLGQIFHVPNPLSLFSHLIPGVDLSGLASHEFWLLPKLQVFWFGLAMFIAVFLHMLWEKDGILERL